MVSIDRKSITDGLRALLVDKTSKPGVYGAHEVSIDWGTKHPRYVDYMTFSPAGTVYVSDIEKGIFTCYEIKSCYEDLYSGKGLNFIGEKNYLVTTMGVWKRIAEDTRSLLETGRTYGKEDKLSRHIVECNPESKYSIGHNIGVLVPVPSWCTKQDVFEQFQNPTGFTGEDLGNWKLTTMIPCSASNRRRSMTEMLFYMVKARGHKK